MTTAIHDMITPLPGARPCARKPVVNDEFVFAGILLPSLVTLAAPVPVPPVPWENQSFVQRPRLGPLVFRPRS